MTNFFKLVQCIAKGKCEWAAKNGENERNGVRTKISPIPIEHELSKSTQSTIFMLMQTVFMKNFKRIKYIRSSLWILFFFFIEIVIDGEHSFYYYFYCFFSFFAFLGGTTYTWKSYRTIIRFDVTMYELRGTHTHTHTHQPFCAVQT